MAHEDTMGRWLFLPPWADGLLDWKMLYMASRYDVFLE